MKVTAAHFQFDKTILSDRSILTETRAEKVESSPGDLEYSEKCRIVTDLSQVLKRKSRGPTFFSSARSACEIADGDICRISAFGSEFWK